jgi:hypothetical protein
VFSELYLYSDGPSGFIMLSEVTSVLKHCLVVSFVCVCSVRIHKEVCKGVCRV